MELSLDLRRHANALDRTSSDAESSSSPPSYAFILHSPSSYRKHGEPLIDNSALARKRRRRTSPDELLILERAFMACQKPNRVMRSDIARKAGMTDRAVQVWFQNRRQSWRRNRKPALLDQLSDAKYDSVISSNPPSLSDNTSEAPSSPPELSSADTSFSSNSFADSNTPKRKPLETLNSNLRLDMSGDGQAVLVVDQKSAPVSRSASNVSNDDYECIENLLSLRNASWF
ncbi:hypothetical protein CANCADRAFT_42138 [Tortispora caseinolytica NRRL Y-17796]|uniref:Homeobox domain-containing protein n=1 Tax=Tortispora caseinolytica NRRL Y-17796 TaxID=767744 RepID=A0A1E4TI97_9ASCO|nr:hypothetical protein CANCADRAFT_42138 [Tortispora caseinolytica NRRL Y-17796]